MKKKTNYQHDVSTGLAQNQAVYHESRYFVLDGSNSRHSMLISNLGTWKTAQVYGMYRASKAHKQSHILPDSFLPFKK